jgi:type IV secretion system pilin
MRALFASLAALLMLVLASPALAVPPPPNGGGGSGGGGTTTTSTGCSSNPAIVTCNQINNANKNPDLNIVNKIGINLINFILTIGGALAIIFIIAGGLRYVVSAGDPGQIATAKATIQYAITGLLVIIFAIVVVNILTKVKF